MEKLRRQTLQQLLLPSMLLAACGPLAIQSAAQTTDNTAVRMLLDRAKILAAHGHGDIAVQTWQQVLLSDPQNREAVAGIARTDMQLGRVEEARGYLARLKRLGGSGEAESIEAMPVVGTPNSQLQDAARFAAQHNYVGAMKIYEGLYGDAPPAGDMALAYYDTEAAIPERRQHAIEGLRKLAARFPDDHRYDVTLGRILTYDPKTRAAGIALLKQHDSSAARDALAQAESWNTAPPAAPEPSSPGKTAKPVDYPGAAGYKALNAGNLQEAEHQFKGVLAGAPDNPQALSGLGYVRMKQRRFAEAQELLEDARRNGASGSGLDDGLSLSRFWATMTRASDAQSSGDLATALTQFRSAQAMRPKSPEAAEGVAGVLLQQKDAAGATDIYRREVESGSTRPQAWKGLLLAQAASGDTAAAAVTAARTPVQMRTSFEIDPGYIAAELRAAQASGNASEASRLRGKVLALPFPNGGRDLTVAQQLEYADLLTLAGRADAASSLYRQVLRQQPENSDAWKALLAGEHQSGHDEQAEAMLHSVPPSVLEKGRIDPDFLALAGSIYNNLGQQDRARDYLEHAFALTHGDRPGITLQLASIYAAGGQSAKAYALFSRELERNPAEKTAWSGLIASLHAEHRDAEAWQRIGAMPEDVRASLEQDPEFLHTLASIQAANGQVRPALASFRRMDQLYRESNVPEPAGAQLEYAWLLERTGDDQGLYALISQLGQSSELTEEEQASFRSLVSNWTVRRAMAALRAGDRPRATALLSAAHSTFPRDPDVSNALAGAYMQEGEPKQALALYSSLDMTAATLPQFQGAIGAALASNDTAHAEAWLETAMNRFPNDSTLLRMAAEYEQSRGDAHKAEAYYRAALQAMGNSPGTAPAGTGSPDSSAPAQRLMQLLAPGSTASSRAPFASHSELDGLLDGPAQAPIQNHAGDGTASGSETLGDFSTRSSSDASDALPAKSYGERDTYADTRSAPASQNLQGFSDNAGTGQVAEDSWAPPAPVAHRKQTAHRVPDLYPMDRAASEQQVDVTLPANHETLASADPSPQAGIGEASDDLPRTFAPVDVPAPPSRPATRYASSQSWASDTEPGGRLEGAVTKLRGSDSTAPNPYARGEAQPERSGSTLPPFSAESASAAASPNPGSGVLPPLTGSHAESVVRPQTPREQIEQQLALIQSSSSPWLGGTSGIAYRSGQPGFDHLAAYSAEIESSASLGPNARLTVVARPVLLDAGTPSVTSPNYRQGTLPVSAIPESQSASGIGGEVQLRTSNFAASLGYTPSGFLVSNVTGDLLIHPQASHFTLTFARQPIVDTQLSWAGLRDIGSRSSTFAGNVWGGVVTNSGELQIASGDASQGWYIQGGGQYITGDHVATNQRADGDAGAYWRVWQNPDSATVTVGANFFGMHYGKNLRYFTYGQGGYFSPSAYMLGNIPVTVSGHSGSRVHYNVVGSLGLQAFSESSTPYFPLDPAIQLAQGNPYYSEQTNVGANYDIQGKIDYALNEHWFGGAYLDANNARDYTSSRVGFYIRYMLRPQPIGYEASPTGIFPTSGLRPLRVP